MKSYRDFVAAFSETMEKAKSLPLGKAIAASLPELPSDAPKVLLFSPHPDDEVITGALPLRLLRQGRRQIINVAITLGRHQERRQPRLDELRGCCEYIGFDVIVAGENGLTDVYIKTRKEIPEHWAKCVDSIAEILRDNRPDIIFFPHDQDWHPGHIAVNHLVLDALKKQEKNLSCFCIETEFWSTMDTPNLMVESSPDDLADLLNALSFHVGEVRRNPYHLRLPAWMIDNVRRGSELVGERGGPASNFQYATLSRLRLWKDGNLQKVLPKGRFLPANEDPASLF